MAFDPEAYLATPVGSPQQPPAPPASGGFDPVAYLGSDAEPKQEALQQSMYVASTKNPDEHAKVIDLSKKSGVPTNLIDKDTMGDVQEKTTQSNVDYPSLLKQAPKYSDWLSKPDNAAVTHDDLQPGANVEKASKDHIDSMNQIDGMWSRIKYDLNAGYENSVTGMIAERSLSQNPLPDDANWADRLVSGGSAYFHDIPWFMLGGSLGGTGGAAIGAPVVGAIGSVVPGLGTLAGIGVGAAGGEVIGGAYGAFALQSALHTAVAEYLKNGAPEDLPDFIAKAKTTLIEANKQGMLGVALAGLGKVVQAGGGVAFGKNAFGEIATQTGRVTTKAVGLGTETAAFGTAQPLMEGRAPGVNDYVDAAAFITMMHGAHVLGESYSERAKAQQTKDFLEKLQQQTEQSKLHERAPEVYGEMMNHITADEPNPDLKIQAQPSTQFVYFQPSKIDEHFNKQGIEPEKAMQSLGVLDSYNEAKRTDTDVKIPMSEYMSKIAKTPHFDALINDAKMTDAKGEVGPSVNEANEAIKQNQADMKAVDEEAQAQADAPPQYDAAGPMKEMLLATGRFTDKEAALAADHHARMVEGIARSSGIPVEEIAKRFPLRVVDGSELVNNTDPDQMTLNQAKVLHGEFGGKPVAEGGLGNVSVDDVHKLLRADFGQSSVDKELKAENDARVEKQTKFLGKKVLEKISDHGKQMLSNFSARFSHSEDKEKGISKAIKRAQDPKEGPYVNSPEINAIRWSPNYAAEPTGTIGEPRIQEPNPKGAHPDPFMWAEDKYKASKELLQKHKDADKPVTINTSSDLVAKADYIAAMPKDTTVNMYMLTRDESLNRMLFPGNPSNLRLESAVHTLREAGIKVNAIRPDAETIVKEINKDKTQGKLVFGEKMSKADMTERVDKAIGLRVLNQDEVKLNQGEGGDEPYGPRGQISFGALNNNFVIDFFKTADLSTAIHELSHFHFEVLGRLAQDEKANALVKDDYAKVLKWLGADSKEAVTTEMHEKFARGVEAYLMEGKAPIEELRPAFARLKAWMLHIYRDIKNLKVELNPEIRGVFDRLVAAEDQVKATQDAQHQEPLFTHESKVKFMGKNADKYFEAVQEARSAAEDRVTKKLLDDYNRAKSEIYNDKRKDVLANAEHEVGRKQVYHAIDTLQRGELADGTKLKLDKKDVIDGWGSKAFEMLKSKEGKYMYAREGGVHPDVAAHLFGYEDGDTMMQDILNAPDKKTVVDQLTKERMDVLFPDSFHDGTLPQEAIDAVHNEKRAHILRMELDELAQHHMPVLKDVIRRVSRRPPSDEVVKAQAKSLIGDKPLSDVRPSVYALAERKSAKLAGEALAKGNTDEAITHKTKELLNHELYRAATEAREYIDKQLKKFKKLSRSDEDVSKSRDTDLVNAARSILASFGLGKSGKTPESYLEKMKAYDPDTYNSVMTLVNSATEKVGDYKSIPFNDFVAMSDAVNAIYDLAKSSKEITIDGKKMDSEIAHSQLKDRITEVVGNPKVRPGVEQSVTNLEKLGTKLLGGVSALTRVEHWVAALDGELRNTPMSGPFRKYIWAPIKEATTAYRIDRTSHMKELAQIFKDLNGRLSSEKIHSPELGYSFKKAEILGALLHSGNESNLQKLLLGRTDKNGRAWGDVKPDGTIDRTRFDQFMDRMRKEKVLTKADYDFAQKVWDLFDKMKAGAQKAHKEMYGYHFDEITAKKFANEFGEYNGGYVPAKIDHFLSEDHDIRQQREQFEKNNNSWQFPTTGRGFTKSRVENYHGPLSLDLNMLASHIDSVMRFTHIEPRVKEVARVVNNKEFRSALSDINSTAGKDLLVPWLQRSAQQQTSVPAKSEIGRGLDTAVKYIRRNQAMQTLVGNFANFLHNGTSAILANTKVGAAHLIGGLHSYVFDHKNTVDAVTEKSDYMRSLKEAHVNDAADAIKKIIADPNAYQSATAKIQEKGYFLQKIMQDAVTTSVWKGAYEQAIRRGAEEQAAVKEADSVVSQTQHVGGAEDMAKYEVGTEFEKMFTQFTGFFNKVLNVNVGSATAISRELGLKKGAAPLAHLYLSGFLVMAASAQLILDKLYGWKPDPEDDDSGPAAQKAYLLHLFFGSQKNMALAMVPYVGPIINSALSHFGPGHGDDIRFSPAASTAKAAADLPGEVYKTLTGEMELKKKTVKDALGLLGVMTGLPFGALARPIGYRMDVESGKANPSGPIDYTRGLLTGAPGNN